MWVHGSKGCPQRFLFLVASVWCLRAWRLLLLLQVNIADDPSREDYIMLQSLGAVEVAPVLDSVFTDPQAWESLSLGNVVQVRRAVLS